jgi:acetyl-CoA carboxylase carboxyltransferase component
MSGAPMQPDALIALATAKPALMGPDAAVNGIHYNRIQAIEDPDERAAFIAQKQAEYAAGIDVFKIANENAVDAVVPADELRAELISRLAVYRRRDRTALPRRNGVIPV